MGGRQMTPSENVLKILGFAMRVPPHKQIESFSEETLKTLADQIRQRFSDTGRMNFARSVCGDLRKFGFQVPKDSDSEDIVWHTDEECSDILLDMDYDTYTDDMVQETLEFIDECLHPQASQPVPEH